VLTTCRAALLAAIVALPAASALGAEPAIRGMRAEPDVALPSTSRVIAAVSVTLGLTVGAIWLMKRFWPQAVARRFGTGVITVVAHANVTPSLRAHIVQIDGARILIVEGKPGIALATLPAAQPPGTAADP
jgi:flagellar biogenesis protein FliO